MSVAGYAPNSGKLCKPTFVLCDIYGLLTPRGQEAGKLVASRNLQEREGGMETI